MMSTLDYTGRDVRVKNFYAVLLGDATAVTGGSGKVVASKPGDKIFVYYTDHGGPGILGLPNLPYIYANDFVEILKRKHASGTYDEMVIYLDACEGGSIFEGLLPNDLNIYVTTASNANEYSWATYCPGTIPPSPIEYDTCIGDLYSVSWMEDSDSQDLRLETLEQQYLKVKERTFDNNSSVGSHVMQYGTLSISNETVSIYQGYSTGEFSSYPSPRFDSKGGIHQRDADLYSMWHMYKKPTLEMQKKKELLKKIKDITAHRAHLDSSVSMIKRYLLGSGHGPVRGQGSALVDDWSCLKFMVRTFETYCGSLTQYGMKHTRTFANICNRRVTKKAMDEAAKKSCSTFILGQWDPAIMWTHTMVFQLKLLLHIALVAQFSAANRLDLVNTFRSVIKPQDNSTTWAVLVAGSNEYYNYRHQADVCHAYQILKKGGLKEENIVVFMYDDIANHPNNPRPGVIINNPKGPDVYAGVPKDYTGKSVTASNFYAVLLGNATAIKGGSGKVIASKPNDRIFVYYTDHGGPGVLAMPLPPYIYANDFIQVLKTKHEMGTYDEMVIYLEACESGSIFEGLLPENLNIYVTTASNAHESSFATYCPAMVPPPPLGFHTCLGDLYSISWMEDSDTHDLRLETLKKQYLKVKKRTINNHTEEGSHVKQYGAKRISSKTVSMFQGYATNVSADQLQTSQSMGVINQRDADLYSMWQNYKRSTLETQQKEELLKKIKDITAHRAHLDNSVEMIKRYLVGSRHGPTRPKGSALVDDWDCLKSMVRTFETHCGALTQYGLKHTRTFANVCNKGVTKKALDEAAKKSCSAFKLGQWDPAIDRWL
ncbi:hypothetical protein QVD17_13371 [Tagetes erecta]|uniref:Legumain prodomain domain-containing protein n=1 Tax=Tagetes erecta TaxID=13708 RepID=A0AAD8L0L2_TARER|nr:hypothetical protein QVD17_13371 [Tagetes erecta]